MVSILELITLVPEFKPVSGAFPHQRLFPKLPAFYYFSRFNHSRSFFNSFMDPVKDWCALRYRRNCRQAVKDTPPYRQANPIRARTGCESHNHTTKPSESTTKVRIPNIMAIIPRNKACIQCSRSSWNSNKNSSARLLNKDTNVRPIPFNRPPKPPPESVLSVSFTIIHTLTLSSLQHHERIFNREAR